MPVPEPEPRPEVDREPIRRPEQRAAVSHFVVRAFAGLGLGLVPRAGFGLGGSIGWQRKRLTLLASGEHWFARTASVPGGGVSISASGGGVSACLSVLQGTVEIPVCGEAAVLAVRGIGEGRGVVPQPQTEAWIGVGPGAGLIWWPWERFGLSAHASGRVGARLPAFHLRRGDEAVDVLSQSPDCARDDPRCDLSTAVTDARSCGAMVPVGAPLPAGRDSALDALEQVYRRHYRRVRWVVRARGVPESALDDVVHDVFLSNPPALVGSRSRRAAREVV